MLITVKQRVDGSYAVCLEGPHGVELDRRTFDPITLTAHGIDSTGQPANFRLTDRHGQGWEVYDETNGYWVCPTQWEWTHCD